MKTFAGGGGGASINVAAAGSAAITGEAHHSAPRIKLLVVFIGFIGVRVSIMILLLNQSRLFGSGQFGDFGSSQRPLV
jgi:hypothetical protein